jgi:hypothetical protein
MRRDNYAVKEITGQATHPFRLGAEDSSASLVDWDTSMPGMAGRYTGSYLG